MSFIEELRKPRIGPFAVFDTAGTGAIAYWLAKRYKWDLLTTVVGVYSLGEVVHLAIGKETPFTKMFNNKG